MKIIIRQWLLRKLHATPNESIPPIIMQKLVNIWTNNTIEKHIVDFYSNGFINHYTKK